MPTLALPPHAVAGAGYEMTVVTPATDGARTLAWDVTHNLLLLTDSRFPTKSWFYLDEDGELLEVSADSTGEPDLDNAAICDPRGEDWDLCQVMEAVCRGLILLNMTETVTVRPYQRTSTYDSAVAAFLQAGKRSTASDLVFP